MEMMLPPPYAENFSKAFPFLFLFFIFFFSEVFSPFPLLNLGYGALFYWTIYRPDLIPLSGLFVLGLVLDGMLGQDLGLSFLQILFFFTMVLFQRVSFFQVSFWVMWVGFLFYMGLFAICLSLSQLIVDGKIAYDSLIYAYLWTAASYPTLSWFLLKVHHLLRN